MKKLYTLISCLFSLATIAQPTITQSDLPAAGLIFRSANDDNYVAPVPAGGANQTWNYTTLMNVTTDTIAFGAATGTPYASLFPGSNLTIYDNAQGSYEYLVSNASGLYVSGLASATDTVIYNPKMLIIPVPFTYQNTTNNFSRLEINNPPYKSVLTTTTSFLADGWGTLMLPGGNTYSNTLRVKNTQVQVDSFYVFNGTYDSLVFANSDYSTSYLWARHGGVDAYLLSISADSAGTTSNSSDYKLSSTVSVPEVASKSNRLSIYPNPVNNVVHIDFAEVAGFTGKVDVFNSTGQCVKTYSLSDINHFVFYTAEFKNGIYHFVANSNTNNRQTGTFIVSH